jgi:hypothetical protein
MTMMGRMGFAAVLAVVFCMMSASPAGAEQTASTPGAKVFFLNLKDGDTVKSPFKIEFGLSGMTIAKAGTDTPGTGHHHLLIDTKLDGAELSEGIPADATHRHFGGGQTEVTLELPPGKHTLQLLLGDGNHVPHKPPVMSAPITVTVQ